MPDKKGRLTPMERTFAKVAAETGDHHYAAHKAGYAHPQTVGAHKMHDPAIQQEILRQQKARMMCEALPIAVATVIDNMTNNAAPFSARNNAAGLVFKYAFGDNAGAQGKAPHEMTAEELAKAISEANLQLATLQSVKADKAKPIIEHEPAKPDLFD